MTKAAKTTREAIEAILAKIAKANKCEVTRAVPHGASRSGIGAFQARKGGDVKVTVRDHDIVVYTPHNIVKSGRSGPKGWEHVTIFNHNADLRVLEKAFKVGLTDKKTNSEHAAACGATVGRKPQKPAEIASQRKALEARLAELKKQEAALKKTVVKRKPKKKAEKAVIGEAVASVATE
jgi:hypothetical protein